MGRSDENNCPVRYCAACGNAQREFALYVNTSGDKPILHLDRIKMIPEDELIYCMLGATDLCKGAYAEEIHQYCPEKL